MLLKARIRALWQRVAHTKTAGRAVLASRLRFLKDKNTREALSGRYAYGAKAEPSPARFLLRVVYTFVPLAHNKRRTAGSVSIRCISIN